MPRACDWAKTWRPLLADVLTAAASGWTRFLRFLLTSGVAAGVNVVGRYLLEFAMPYQWAVAVAYLFGLVTGFLLARQFVFTAAPDRAGGQFMRFALVNAIAFVPVWVVSVGLAKLLFPAIGFDRHAETVAHVIGVASPAVTNYFLHQHFSFRVART